MKRLIALLIAVGVLQKASALSFVDSILSNTVTIPKSSNNEDLGFSVESRSSVDARASPDCSDSLPTVMTTDSGCQKLKQDCSTLQTECSKRLSIAIGNSKNAKKCKKALKKDGQTLVEFFCADTCNKCVCRLTEDCPVSTPYCRQSVCYECLGDKDCSFQKPYCIGNDCTECTIDSHCTSSSKPKCNNNICSECKSADDCTTTHFCDNGVCSTCSSDLDCERSNEYCDTDDHSCTTFSGYTYEQQRYCDGSLVDGIYDYLTISEAIEGCNADSSCGCVVDDYCDGGYYYLHKGTSTSTTSDGTCSWVKT